MPKIPTKRLLDLVSDEYKARHLIPASEKGLVNLPKGAGPLAGTAADLPLAPPHIANKKLPLVADTLDAMQNLEKVVAGDKAAIEEAAQRMGAQKEKQLEDYFAKKMENRAKGITTPDDTVPGVGLVQKTANALGMPQRKLMQYVAQKLGKPGSAEDSEKSSQQIVEAVSDKLGLGDSTPANIAKALGVAGLEVFGDPLQAVPVGKIAKGFKAVSKAPGVLGEGAKMAEKSIEALARKMRANTAMDVLRTKKPKSTAELLAEKGAEVIVPKGSIIKSRP